MSHIICTPSDSADANCQKDGVSEAATDTQGRLTDRAKPAEERVDFAPMIPGKASAPPVQQEDADCYFVPSNSYPICKSARRIFRALGKLLTMFVYCGLVVELCLKRREEYDLKVVSPSAFRSRVESIGTILRHGMDDGQPIIRPSRCSKDAAEALLATLEAQQYLPPISSLVSSPVLIATGNRNAALLGRGYHPVFGGLFVTKGKDPIDVPPVEARVKLLWLLRQFKFATPSDHARAVAMILTPALVFGKLVGENRVPMFLVAADHSGTGKGYLTRLVTAIYGENPKPVAQRDGGVGGFDEDFNARLFEGHPFLVLDNLRGRLNSTHIECFLTADASFLARTPHRSAVDVDPSRFIVLATSNGFETTPDLWNRTVTINLRKRPPGYNFGPYPEGDLIAHVRARQPYYLGCVHAVLREWIAEGSLQTTENRHFFRDWARTSDWILVRLFKGHKLGRLLDTDTPSHASGSSLRDFLGLLRRKTTTEPKVQSAMPIIAQYSFRGEDLGLLAIAFPQVRVVRPPYYPFLADGRIIVVDEQDPFQPYPEKQIIQIISTGNIQLDSKEGFLRFLASRGLDATEDQL